MKRLAATTALVLALTACSSSGDTSTPTTASDDGPRDRGRDVVRTTVPDWDGYADAEIDAQAVSVCRFLDQNADDVGSASNDVILYILDRHVERTLGEALNHAGQAMLHAATFECPDHRTQVNEWNDNLNPDDELEDSEP